MTPPTLARLAYVILYVDDIDTAVKFYKDVFMFDVRRVDNSRKWAELETGSTTLAFTPLEQRETKLTGGMHVPGEHEQRQNMDISISVSDVHDTYQRALIAGAKKIAKPEQKNWGQIVGYIRDSFGITVQIGSHLT
ncbi:unnamed protein product [Closterium sp. Yama58-4]|nr:unnamed protein product [Closterium sp. Yama58-4]